MRKVASKQNDTADFAKQACRMRLALLRRSCVPIALSWLSATADRPWVERFVDASVLLWTTAPANSMTSLS